MSLQDKQHLIRNWCYTVFAQCEASELGIPALQTPGETADRNWSLPNTKSSGLPARQARSHRKLVVYNVRLQSWASLHCSDQERLPFKTWFCQLESHQCLHGSSHNPVRVVTARGSETCDTAEHKLLLSTTSLQPLDPSRQCLLELRQWHL